MAVNVTLTTKQKVIGILTVVIFAFIIYEVIGFFSPEKQAEPVAAPVKSASSTQSKQTTTVTTRAKPGTATSPSSQPVLAAVPAIAVTREGIDFQKQREQQQNYLDSVNQLQLLKVRREIAETNQAIAAARLATESANKSMSDLLTQPAVMPVAPGGNFAGAPPIPAQSGEQSAPPPPVQVLDVPFTVVSVSMQMNRWNAVLGYQDKLYSVSLGDRLFDGSKVASINKSGVTLVKDGKRRRISIQTTI